MDTKNVVMLYDQIVSSYRETEDNKASTTVKIILDKMSLLEAAIGLRAYAEFKKHDGRISERNRDWLRLITISEDIDWVVFSADYGYEHAFRQYGRDMKYPSLDEVHPAHIDNVITVLRSNQNKTKLY